VTASQLAIDKAKNIIEGGVHIKLYLRPFNSLFCTGTSIWNEIAPRAIKAYFKGPDRFELSPVIEDWLYLNLRYK
jgi:hypothetical protein